MRAVLTAEKARLGFSDLDVTGFRPLRLAGRLGAAATLRRSAIEGRRIERIVRASCFHGHLGGRGSTNHIRGRGHDRSEVPR